MLESSAFFCVNRECKKSDVTIISCAEKLVCDKLPNFGSHLITLVYIYRQNFLRFDI